MAKRNGLPNLYRTADNSADSDSAEIIIILYI